MSAVIGRYRWFVCALLFFATTINYIDRQILSLIKNQLDAELHWTNADFGLVQSAFQGAYAIGLLFFGWFVDRFGTKVGYAVSIVGWSLAAAAHSMVGSFWGFVAARIGLGVPEGGNFPSAIKSVALWFPKRERALATSIFNSGTNVGAIAAPATVPFIVEAFGNHWQAPFVFAGVLGMLWLLLWIPFYEVPAKIKKLHTSEMAHIRSDADETDTGTKVAWGRVLGYRQAWAFVVAKFLTDPVWWFFLIWLPDYFKKTRGLDIKKSWVHLVTIYSIITVLSIFGGWLPGYLNRKGWTVTRARKTGMFAYALCVLPILLVTKAGDWHAVLLIGLAGSAHQAWSANLFTTVSDMFPKRAVASVTGLGGMAGAVGGMLFQPFAGKLLDSFGGAGYVTLFAICAFAYLLAFALNHLLAPKFEQVSIPDA